MNFLLLQRINKGRICILEGVWNVEEIFRVIVKTMISYGIILFIFRIMGKREIGELSIIDIVVYLMMAELAVLAIEQPDTPFINAILPMFVLMGIQMITAFISLKSKKFRDLLEGEPVIIIKNGKIDEEEMKKQRYNFDDLFLQLRQHGVRNIAEVDYAILENSGRLSVFIKEEENQGIAVPLIMDGFIQKKHLRMIGKNERWLLENLHKLGYKDIKNISLCSYDNGHFFVDLK